MIFLIDPKDQQQIARFEKLAYAILAGRLMAADLKKTLELREGDGEVLVATLMADGTVKLG